MLSRKCTICSACEPCSAIRSVQKPVFHRYLPICCASNTHRCLDLEIWRFSWQTYRPITLPLAHACGVNIKLNRAAACDVITHRNQHKIHFRMARPSRSTNVCHTRAALVEFLYKWMPLHSAYNIAMLVYEKTWWWPHKVSARVWICHAEVR